jgi:hypothetical protein
MILMKSACCRCCRLTWARASSGERALDGNSRSPGSVLTSVASSSRSHNLVPLCYILSCDSSNRRYWTPSR